MKIVQVLTYLSADAAYGGPVAVARSQCEELARRGHEVHLITGWDGVARTELPGVQVHRHPIRQLPGLGFAGFYSPSLWRDVRALAADADVVHLHYARDLIQLPVGRLAATAPLVLQAHGMIRPDTRRSARLLDRAFTRPTYRRAALHLALTDQEVDDLPLVGTVDASRIRRIRNGVALAERPAAVAVRTPRVVYVARLHERKRPVAFVEAAAEVLARGIEAEFSLYGPDSGEGPAVREAIERLGIGHAVHYRGPLAPEKVPAVLGTSHVYVLPSRAEPFPMSLLEAMAHGLPSVITDDTGISAELAERGAAMRSEEHTSELQSH